MELSLIERRWLVNTDEPPPHFAEYALLESPYSESFTNCSANASPSGHWAVTTNMPRKSPT